jgi:rRNA maturation RNase YbeY
MKYKSIKSILLSNFDIRNNKMSKVRFIHHDRSPILKNRKQLKLFIENLFIQESKVLNGITFIFCSDEYLLDINNQFLKHDFYTDVITFDLSSEDRGIQGEVYLSIDRIKDNAKELNILFIKELHRVVFHGALHLCGYKDKKREEIAKMRFKEDKYLKMYFM